MVSRSVTYCCHELPRVGREAVEDIGLLHEHAARDLTQLSALSFVALGELQDAHVPSSAADRLHPLRTRVR